MPDTCEHCGRPLPADVDLAKLLRGAAAVDAPKVDSKGKPVLDKGKRPMTVKRKLKPADVLDFTAYPDRVVLVTTWGAKHTVDRPQS